MQVDGVPRTLSVTVLLDDGIDAETLEDIREDVSVAVTEILADFPGNTPLPLQELTEDVRPVSGALAPTDIFAHGVIFERWERPQ